MDAATTPTNETFVSSALAAQKPLPNPAFSESPADKSQQSSREVPNTPRKPRNPADMNTNDSDGETGPADDAAALSDAESVTADGSKANKKKRSQRFYCTEYPPCNLSFTRSEHLARHIRKHTGERPFQCHCSRRFSRLDNLRQHAQTVHVNEDIPIDSLAATGTRFQRQIRTDRVRASAGRARTTTSANIAAPPRGHSKSLSTSSIASVGSVASTVYPSRDDMRRRPPPLVMADPRNPSYRPGIDNQYRPLTPTDYASPPSATFSNGQGSPRWSQPVVSPPPSHGRAQSMYIPGSRPTGRRLSVPSSTGNPFQSPPPSTMGRPPFGSGPMNASNNGLYSASNGGLLASPTTSTTSSWSRRDSTSTIGDEAWRRRTWHPDTHEYNGNGGNPSTSSGHLNHMMTSYQAPTVSSVPLANPAAQQSNLRLPGIESFDPIPRHRPGSPPPNRASSPMAIDADNAQPMSILRNPVDHGLDDRRMQSNGQWEMPLHRNLNRLEIAPGVSPRDSSSAWANDTSRALMGQAERSQRQMQQTVRFEDDVRPAPTHYSGPDPSSSVYVRGHQHSASAPAFNVSTPRHQKRQGWYQGPPSSLSSSNTSTNTRVDRMVHPNLASGFQGFPARVPQTVPEHRQQVAPQTLDTQRYSRPQPEQDSPESLRRLEALVAVATSEVSTATAY